MAKAARKTRARPSRARVSTRRASNRRGAHARTRRAKRPTTVLADAPETIEVVLDLRDVSGKGILDPETFFTFRRLTGNRQIGDQHAIELTGTPVVLALPPQAGDIVVCEVDPQRFRFVHSPAFFRTPGASIRKELRLFREPNEWTAQFARWSDLAPAFDDLKRVLSASPAVELFKNGPVIGRLAEAGYDDMSGPAVVLAKTAMLNTYYRLNAAMEPVSGARTWFSFVSRMLAIGRERVLALVDLEMESMVHQIHDHIDEFRADYERTPAENHRGNVPAALQSRIRSMVSIKSTHRRSNFQLTLTRLSGPDEALLDADIDESGDLLGHLFDLFKHKVSGGTHPHDIHELLLHQDGDLPGFDLGYRLV
jgi:hypothetical protein